MKTKFSSIILFFASAVLLSSCAKYPEAEVQSAKDAIAKAQTAGAEVYANDQFLALQDSLNSALIDIEEERSKFFPSYDANLTRLSTIITASDEVIAATETRKNEIREEISQTLVEIQKLLSENNDLIASAPKGKEGTEALMQIKDELSVVQTTVDEVQKMLETEELIATRDKSNSALDKATSINTELKEVIAKYNQARGKRS